MGEFVVIISCILLIIFVLTFIGKELFHPIFICTAYWISFLSISFIFSYLFDLKLNINGLVPIVVLLYTFLLGAILAQPNFINRKKKKENHIIQGESQSVNTGQPIVAENLKFFVILYSMAGIGAVLLQLNYHNIFINSLTDIFKTASKISGIRYSGGVDMPKYGLILMAFFYAGGFLGGAYYLFANKTLNKGVAILPVLVAILLTIINGANFFFVYTILIWLVGYMTTYIFLTKGIVNNVKKVLIKIVVLITFCLLLVPVAQNFRGGNSTTGVHITPGAISYVGSFNAFSIWWNNYEYNKMTPFKYSIAGIYDIFLGGRKSGLFSESVTIGYYENKKIETNVYTLVRILIEDYTIYGAMCILFFTGFFMIWFYEKTKKQSIAHYILLSIGFNILLWSFATNILNYNTIILSWAVIYVSFVLITKVRLYQFLYAKRLVTNR